MTDTDPDELEAIRERKRERLVEQHGEADSSQAPPEEPMHVEGEEHFQELLSSYQTVLVDCYADWCGPCQMMEPTVQALAAETDAAVVKVDVDANQRLAQQLGAQGVPTFLVYRDGDLVERLVGAQDRGTLEALLA